MTTHALRRAADYIKQQKRGVKRRRRLSEADVVVVSCPKSGRTWLAVLISHVYHQRYGIDARQIIRFDNFHKLHAAIPRIFFTHDNRKFPPRQALAPVERYARKKLILLVRDPRDVAVSSYFNVTRRHLAKRPWKVAGRETPALFDYVVGTGLPKVVEFMARWQRNLGAIECSLVVRYEDLRAQPAAELTRVMAFIGERVAPDLIEHAVEFGSFASLRAKEAEGFFESSRLRPVDRGDPHSFKARRGKVGGYRDHFDAEQRARIDALIPDELLDAFGYRRDPLDVGLSGRLAGAPGIG